MVKKRLIFTLLYDKGAFMLSRNFRLQRVGDVNWLKKNYNFSHIAESIDELVILDVTRDARDPDKFCADVERVVEGCFMPLALGGGVASLGYVRQLMEAGADKIIVNTVLYKDPEFVRDLVRHYGSQCVIASIDYKRADDDYVVYTNNGRDVVESSLESVLKMVLQLGVGEIYLNSIDQDGAGQGYCMDVLSRLGGEITVPIIMAGGAGNFRHLLVGIEHSSVDAVATANLFNFIGDGLPRARNELLSAGISLARW